MGTAAVRPMRVPVSGSSFARDSVRLTHTPRGCVDDWPRRPRGVAISGHGPAAHSRTPAILAETCAYRRSFPIAMSVVSMRNPSASWSVL